MSAIKVLLDVGDVDGAVGKEGVGEDAEGFASEFAKETLDACPARALRVGVALVVTVTLKARAVLVLERARRMRGVYWEGGTTNLHPPKKKYSAHVVTFPRERMLLHSRLRSSSPLKTMLGFNQRKRLPTFLTTAQ